MTQVARRGVLVERIAGAKTFAIKAQTALDGLVDDLPENVRADKSHVSDEVERALQQLREAVRRLEELEVLLQTHDKV